MLRDAGVYGMTRPLCHRPSLVNRSNGTMRGLVANPCCSTMPWPQS